MGNKFDEKHYGFFRGIVMQNNDPERRGRVKIAIPEFTSHLARELGLSPDVYGARFVGGGNINTLFNKEALKKFCEVLMWAEQAAPLLGSGTSGVFDAKSGIATVGEGHRGGDFREILGDESITPSGESVAPKACLATNAVPGGFGTGCRTGMCDVHNEAYAPSPINNATKGSFSIPRVGAQVWVFFEGGSVDRPVYIGYVFDKSDWNSVMNPQGSNPSLHYPGPAENIQDNEAYFFTGQTVLNTKAGSVEFVETDDFEKIKISHYSGSFYEIGNHNTVEVNVSNKATVTNVNEHHTIKGDSALICEGERHEIFRGDFHLTYGDPDNKTFYDEWIEKAKPAFLHAANFSQQSRFIEDPTKSGGSKGGPNKTFSHPTKLTLETNWTNLLKGMNPSKYMKKVQHTELGVK